MRKVNHQKVTKTVWAIVDGMLRQTEIQGHRVRLYNQHGLLKNISTVYPQPLSKFARVTTEVESIVRKGIQPHGLPYHTFYKLRKALTGDGI